MIVFCRGVWSQNAGKGRLVERWKCYPFSPKKKQKFKRLRAGVSIAVSHK